MVFELDMRGDAALGQHATIQFLGRTLIICLAVLPRFVLSRGLAQTSA
jgi:hypothetical protein